MKTFCFSLMLLCFFAVASAYSNDVYDCYQGFDSFPNDAQSAIKKTFFVIPVFDYSAIQQENGKDKFVIMNDAGSEILTVNTAPVVAFTSPLQEKKDFFPVKPVGEIGVLQTEFHMHLKHDLPDSGYFTVPGESKDIDAKIAAQNPNPESKLMSELDARSFLKYASQIKGGANQSQFKHEESFHYDITKLGVKYGVNVVKKAYAKSLAKLDGCIKIGDQALSDAAEEQKKLLLAEIQYIDQLKSPKNSIKTAPQTSAPPVTGHGATNPNGGP